MFIYNALTRIVFDFDYLIEIFLLQMLKDIAFMYFEFLFKNLGTRGVLTCLCTV